MIRLILIAIVVVLALAGGAAVALNHHYGWKGLIALPFILIAFVWLGKIVISKLAKKFLLGLFGVKSGVLRGATMTVHSIHAVPKPPEPPAEDEEGPEDVDDPAAAPEAAEPEEVRHYYAVEVTITPQAGEGERVWEPGELLLTSEKLASLEDLEDEAKEVGTVEESRVWNGTAFVLDEECKYSGGQKLRVTFAVKPGSTMAWLHYYSEPLGLMALPPWQAETRSN